eukprot:COSAG05_NODE_14411_length_397_cov_1.365772_1_plen_50_part_10
MALRSTAGNARKTGASQRGRPVSAPRKLHRAAQLPVKRSHVPAEPELGEF